MRVPTAMGFMRIGLAVTGTLAGLAMGATVTLRPDEVDIPLAPDELLENFRARFAAEGREIIANGGDRLVRRFKGKAGPFPYCTVELVTYHPDGITFDHLAGPFSRCHERFGFDAIPTGTRVVHTGAFRLRGGVWTTPLALTAVRHAFEAHVRQHLEALAFEMGEAQRLATCE